MARNDRVLRFLSDDPEITKEHVISCVKSAIYDAKMTAQLTEAIYSRVRTEDHIEKFDGELFASLQVPDFSNLRRFQAGGKSRRPVEIARSWEPWRAFYQRVVLEFWRHAADVAGMNYSILKDLLDMIEQRQLSPAEALGMCETVSARVSVQRQKITELLFDKGSYLRALQPYYSTEEDEITAAQYVERFMPVLISALGTCL